MKMEDGLAIVNAFAEQARILLDQIDSMSQIFGKRLAIPGWSEALVGAADFVTGMASCVMDARGNHFMLMMCPARYETAAADLFKLVTNRNAPWRGSSTGNPF